MRNILNLLRHQWPIHSVNILPEIRRNPLPLDFVGPVCPAFRLQLLSLTVWTGRLSNKAWQSVPELPAIVSATREYVSGWKGIMGSGKIDNTVFILIRLKLHHVLIAPCIDWIRRCMRGVSWWAITCHNLWYLVVPTICLSVDDFF